MEIKSIYIINPAYSENWFLSVYSFKVWMQRKVQMHIIRHATHSNQNIIFM